MDPLPLLTELGLTRYEAQAYLALLEQQPLTAYELAKHSGIPSSKIYEVVNKLSIKNLCQAVASNEGSKKHYIAMEAEQLVHAKTRHAQNTGAELLRALANRDTKTANNLIWSITSEQEILSRAEQIIEQAEQYLLLSVWPQQLAAISEQLKHAQQRGIKIAMVHFGQPSSKIGVTYHHPVEQNLYREKGGRSLNLVADSKQMLTATFLKNGKVDGAFSQNKTFVNVTEDYIRHDVYITKTTKILHQQMQHHFGENYEALRDVFNPLGALS